jgi:chaperonin GroEL (HSP60 family)
MRSNIREAYALACLEGKFEKENIRFMKKLGGCIEESSLIKGVVIKKEKAHPNMPDRMKKLRIAIATEKPGINRLELKKRGEGPIPIKLNPKNALEIEKYTETEQRLKLQGLDRLFDLGANVLLCEQPLEACVKDKLVMRGVFALETVNKKDTEAVARATGAKSVGQIRELVEEDLGVAEELYTENMRLEKTVTIQGCKGTTFMLRGSTPQKIDEAEAAVKNGLTVLKIIGQDSRVLPGSGATEAEIARELKMYAISFLGKEQLAIQFYGDALMEIPKCLAENYGLNPVDAVFELKKLHAEGLCNYGIGEKSCRDTVCLEPARIKRSVIRRAFEVSSLMLRIDELLLSTDIAKFHKKE